MLVMQAKMIPVKCQDDLTAKDEVLPKSKE